MSNKIYPIVFFSVSNDGKEMSDAIQNFSFKINQPVYSKFVRFVFFKDNVITTSINDEALQLPFNNKKTDKLNNYATVNKNRQKFLSVFETVLGDIKNIDNRNYALENDFEIEKTQIIILSSIDDPYLSPLIMPLMLGIDALKYEVNYQLLLLYNQEITSNKSNDSGLLKNSFLREIETLGVLVKPKVWLMDIVNDRKINLIEKSNLHHVVSQFVDLIISDAESIDRVTYSSIEKDRSCMYSSIGYSILRFPVEKAKEYMALYAYSKEFNELTKTFDLKFESILLKDELSKFLKRNGFEEVIDKICKQENTDLIFVPFTFDENQVELEKKEVLSKQHTLVNSPSTLSKIYTSDFFQKIDESEKIYKNSILIEFSSHLNAAKNRELSNYLQSIENAQYDFLNNHSKGINYSILFAAILDNNKAIVESMLDGRFTNDIPTLISLEDKYRGVFVGDEVSLIEKEVRVESDNSSHKSELVKQYLLKIEADEASFKKIDATKNPDNPKLAELKATIGNYNNQITTLAEDIENHNKKITVLISQIEKIKSDFDRDATKEKYKIKRNVDLLKEIENTKNTELDSIDEPLSKKYEDKNVRIKERKKFIFYNLILIPSIILMVSILIQAILYYNFKWFDTNVLIKGVIATLVIELIYYIFYFIKFYSINKQFKMLLGDIGDLLQKKNNIFQKYIDKKNMCFKNDFSFEVDLLAFSMMNSLKEGTAKLQNKSELFKEQLLIDSKKYFELKESFSFIENSFELCILEKQDLEAIYNNNLPGMLFDSSDNNNNNNNNNNMLSLYYNDFNETNNLILLNQLIDKRVDEIFNRKIENENLKSILFNETDTFGIVNTSAKFKILFETSRPLLQTPKSYFPNISADIPYTENIIIGFRDNAYGKFLGDSGLKFNDSIKIEEGNHNILGVLSIKSNFPSFIIYDVEANENLIRNEINLNNKEEYFISDSAFDFQLMPILKNVELDEKGEALIGDQLIGAITKKIIQFDTVNGKFFHAVIGDLGVKFEDLINYWNSPLCFEINKKAKQIDDEIWKYEEDELIEYLKEFKTFWIEIKAIMPKNYENELAEYFFARKGHELDWKDIKAAFKENRRNK